MNPLNALDNVISKHQPLFKHVFQAEWFLLILAVGMTALILPLRHGIVAASLCVSLVVLALLALLTLNLPDQPGDSVLKKISYITTEFCLVSFTVMTGLTTVAMPLYFPVLAKACMLFDGRLRNVVLGLCLVLAPICFGLKSNIAYIKAHGELPGKLLTIIVSGLIVNVGYIGLMCVVAVWVLSLSNEQKLRAKAEQLSREVEQLAKEVERARIAREVHDTLGHSLTSLKLQLEVARRFDGKDDTKAKEALRQAEELASRSLSDVRLALGAIRNADEGFNFNAAVGELAKQANQSDVLSVNCDLEQAEVPSAIGYQLFRVVQECLTNTLKHADAKTVSISASTANGVLKLIVKDDGKGLKGQPGELSFGLKGMEERVANLRGKLAVESASGQGTQVTVEVPLSNGAGS